MESGGGGGGVASKNGFEKNIMDFLIVFLYVWLIYCKFSFQMSVLFLSGASEPDLAFGSPHPML